MHARKKRLRGVMHARGLYFARASGGMMHARSSAASLNISNACIHAAEAMRGYM
jgi:hypothetical protein